MENIKSELTAEEMESVIGGGNSLGSTGKTTANVRLRSSRSTSSSSNIILVIPSGRTVTILGESGSWYKVRYNGQTGYVSSDYIS